MLKVYIKISSDLTHFITCSSFTSVDETNIWQKNTKGFFGSNSRPWSIISGTSRKKQLVTSHPQSGTEKKQTLPCFLPCSQLVLSHYCSCPPSPAQGMVLNMGLGPSTSISHQNDPHRHITGQPDQGNSSLGLFPGCSRSCEVDHYVSPWVGGWNLWWTPENAH